MYTSVLPTAFTGKDLEHLLARLSPEELEQPLWILIKSKYPQPLLEGESTVNGIASIDKTKSILILSK